MEQARHASIFGAYDAAVPDLTSSDNLAPGIPRVRISPSIMEGGIAEVSKIHADAVAPQYRSILEGVLTNLFFDRDENVAAVIDTDNFGEFMRVAEE